MTERKFTPPTKFPAEYVNGDGNKAVILGRGPHKVFPFIGHGTSGQTQCWAEDGSFFTSDPSRYDLHDIPKRITTWHNVYPKGVSAHAKNREEADLYGGEERLCVYRIERDEDGGNPEIFVEEV